MVKVAHLTTVDSSLRYLLMPQLRATRDLGWETIGMSAPGPDVAYLESEGIRHIPLHSSTRSFSARSDLKAALELRRVLQIEKPDLLHTHNPKPGLYGRVLGRLSRTPMVVNTVHGLYATENDSIAKRALVYGLEWLAAQFSDAELVQSIEDVEVMRRLHIGRESKRFHLGNGVDLSRFVGRDTSDANARIREELGIPLGAVVVGCVARLVAEKGIPELIEAWEDRSADYSLVLVGPEDPHKVDALDPGTISRAMDGGVHVLGHREDVPDLYASWDLFALPSHREGFPRAAMEAAASGLPIVATDIRGCREVVDNGINGLLIPVGDPSALRDAIDGLVTEADRRLEMGRRGREKALQEFGEDALVARVLDAYRRVAARKGLDAIERELAMATVSRADSRQ